MSWLSFPWGRVRQDIEGDALYRTFSFGVRDRVYMGLMHGDGFFSCARATFADFMLDRCVEFTQDAVEDALSRA